MLTVGVDTGGTFTDFVYRTEDGWKVLKIPSTPENPARAVLEGLKVIGGKGRRVIHGTTVATNTLLERKGARTAFVTNRGFEDLLRIGRQNRRELYSFKVEKTKHLVDRELSFGLNCRLNSKGKHVEVLKEEELEELIKRLKEKEVESVAVCFLFSFLNPVDERRVKERLEEEGFYVSISSEIVPEFREYERASTTVVNAYVMPRMDRYISYLEENLEAGDTLRIMQSNGGTISPETAKREAVRTVLSGPAGGVVGAWKIGERAGFKKLITLDMGGTSTDVSLIDGEPKVSFESKISDIPIKVPVVEVHTVGAGGGSIAYIDRGGALQVGPESAGAFPGPICYGRGGERITVTDANLFLGRLEPDFFLGGGMKLYPEKLKEPFEEMARNLGVTPLEVAEGIVDIANSKMAKALRVISVERGYDPEEFTLLSFGGAGGLHSAYLARELGIPRVLIPQNPGILSALGMVMSDVIKDFSKTVMMREEEATEERIEEIFSEIEKVGLKEMEKEGVEGEVLLERFVDVRYRGQSFEITVPYSKRFMEEFEELHRRIYGYTHSRDKEVVTLRVRLTGVTEKPETEEFEEVPMELPSEAVLKEKEVFFEGTYQKTPVIDREKLNPGNEFSGPALIVEYSSTTLVPPWAKVKVDRFKNLILEVKDG
ncbi:N-methylhydantoinase A [Balnearium lithotrophicum]|uniref:N-methylhydantoinase A n=1 Tax=Balnearium lithotrophicum TaxID=223788 RepID=A0A521BVU1_9BACT|nr:hydantoinase/oxoprolinase family protein [Balnearium lithotrophicum]SMO51288.1 N-methylhydantoinase A [Balnearium lithotrophicum]